MYSYNSLTKPSENLLGTEFAEGGSVKLDLSKSTLGIQGKCISPGFFVSKFTQDLDWISYKIKRSSSGRGIFEISYFPKHVSEYLKLRGKSEVEYTSSVAKSFFSGEVSFASPTLNALFSVSENPLTLNNSLVFGKNGQGIGSKMEFEVATQSIKNFGIAAWWAKRSYNLVFRYDQTDTPIVKTFFYQKLTDKLQIASKLETNLYDKEANIEFGASYQSDSSLKFKAKTSDQGNLIVGVIKKIDDNVTLQASAKGKLFQRDLAKYDYGFRLNLRY